MPCEVQPSGIRTFENYNGGISAICADCIDGYYQCGRHGRLPIPIAVRRAVLSRDGKICQLCGKQVGNQLHLDHVIPYALGGADSVDNLRVTCAPCNLGRPKPKRVRPVACGETRHDRISLALAGNQPRAMARISDQKTRAR